MGMFDYYKPIPDLECPICKVVLDGWQGKNAACGLFVWHQRIAFPVSQEADDCNIDDEDRKKVRLPEKFDIYTNCENCKDNRIEAACETRNEVWSRTGITKIEKTPKLPRKWFTQE